MRKHTNPFESLPPAAAEYIRMVVGKMGYSREVRREVFQELIDHFADALRSCRDDKEQAERAAELVEEFGDPRMLARLIRRGKKRCRPAWKKALVRVWQAAGVTIGLMILYALWLFTGEPDISCNYLARLNQLTRPDIREEDNAWPLLQRAIDLYVPLDPNHYHLEFRFPLFARNGTRLDIISGPEDDCAVLDDWARRNEPAWREFLHASQKRHSWHELRTVDGSDFAFRVRLPSYDSLRKLARAGAWRAAVDAREGKLDQATDRSLAIIRVGTRLNYAVLSEGMVGLATRSVGHASLRNLLYNHEFTSAQLVTLQRQLEEIGEGGGFAQAVEAERLGLLDVVQRTFTDGGPGGGHMLPQRFYEFTKESGQRRHEEAATLALGVLHAGRDETVRVINEVFDRYREESKLTPYQCKQQRDGSWRFIARLIDNRLGRTRYRLLAVLLPAFYSATEINYQGKASYHATVATIALLRWRKDKGRFPEKLEELVAEGYLSSLPADPYSDGALKYRRTDADFTLGTDADFTLYSIGGNFKDDNGDSDFDFGGPIETRGARLLDIVYWPPVKTRWKLVPGYAFH
jgi:hypothetical protein